MSSSQAPDPGRTGRRVRAALLLVGLVFIGWLVARSLPDLRATLVGFEALPFALSVLLGVLVNVVAGIVFTALMRQHAYVMPWTGGIGLVLLAQIAKYVPGGVFGLLYQAATVGAGRQSMVAVTVCNLDLMAVTALGSLFAALAIVVAPHSLAGAAAVLATGLVAVVLWERLGLMARIAMLLPQRWRRVAARPVHGGGRWAALLYAAMALINVPALTLLLHATVALPVNDALVLVAALNVAWVLGMVAFVFPSGVGVRELAFILIAQQAAGDPALGLLSAVAVIARLWQVVVDMAGALAWSAVQRLARRTR